MGQGCSKSSVALDHGLESDPRNLGSKQKKKVISLSSPINQVKGGGLCKRDPPLFALQQQSIALQQQQQQQTPNQPPLDANLAGPNGGQFNLLYKQQQKSNLMTQAQQQQQQQQSNSAANSNTSPNRSNRRPQQQSLPSSTTTRPDAVTTRLVVRRHQVRAAEEGMSGTHIYAIRWPKHLPLQLTGSSRQEQSPHSATTFEEGTDSKRTPAVALRTTAATAKTIAAVEPTRKQTTPPSSTFLLYNNTTTNAKPLTTNPSAVDHLFHPSTLALPPRRQVVDWATVSHEHGIHVADVGLSAAECDHLVAVTEQVCRGQYAAYTYAKQTLGCREFPILANAVHEAVHTIVHAIIQQTATTTASPPPSSNCVLSLDDREPHMVKYDVTKKERRKLDMHTDKSEWTFLISLSNGCGMDYEGGGTYFECLDATIHVQRGHAVIFPGKLRHCGQRISMGLRFLLVGFLVDKSATVAMAPDDDFALTNMP